MIYQAMQLHVCREAGGQYWNLGQGKREDISRTQKLIISLDRFHLSRSDRAAAERAGMLYSSQSGIHICRETSSTICSNFSFIKMELNFIRINHIQLEIWGAGEKNCAWLKRKKKRNEQESQHENSCSDGTWKAQMAVWLNCAYNNLLKCQPVTPEMATFL